MECLALTQLTPTLWNIWCNTGTMLHLPLYPVVTHYKARLNTLVLPPLLSITFVPSAFYAYVWNILEPGTSKANFRDL